MVADPEIQASHKGLFPAHSLEKKVELVHRLDFRLPFGFFQFLSVCFSVLVASLRLGQIRLSRADATSRGAQKAAPRAQLRRVRGQVPGLAGMAASRRAETETLSARRLFPVSCWGSGSGAWGLAVHCSAVRGLWEAFRRRQAASWTRPGSGRSRAALPLGCRLRLSAWLCLAP